MEISQAMTNLTSCHQLCSPVSHQVKSFWLTYITSITSVCMRACMRVNALWGAMLQNTPVTGEEW
jgi:hypothetical protein